MTTRTASKPKQAKLPIPEPRGAKSNNHKSGRPQSRRRRALKSASEWRELGVEIAQVKGELDASEQETTISFLRGGRYAEITTADNQWQKRIESLGVKPRSITTFKDGNVEIRYYDRVPKGYVRMPSAGGEQLS